MKKILCTKLFLKYLQFYHIFQQTDSVKMIPDDFCGMSINTPLGGKETLTSIAVQTFPTKITAVATTSINDHTIAFLGTETGYLKKVVIKV